MMICKWSHIIIHVFYMTVIADVLQGQAFERCANTLLIKVVM